MKFKITRKLHSSLLEYAEPAREERDYAYAETPIGVVTLTRSPSKSNSPDALANKHEDWKLLLNGESRMMIKEIAAPGYPARSRLRTGVDATICGTSCRIRAGGALRPSRRFFETKFPDSSTIRFHTNGLNIELEGPDGHTAGKRSAGKWQMNALDTPEFFAVCLFEIGDFDYFLSSPLLTLF
ncbi:hypothetical protein ABTZ59_36225 [Streptomyces sp. NPDC094034]|uniref:hypothetical protein n=1 Tax=Streptomyces sp. NPDC094034 TaxID=3155309 RepID=UPI00332996C6